MDFWKVSILILVLIDNIKIICSVPFGSSEDIVLVTEPVAVTFTYPSAVLRFQPWDFQKNFKLEIKFNTREHRGILFFVGASKSSQDCIGIEIFNQNLFVYGILNEKEFRIQMNPPDKPVSHGKYHSVALQLLTTGYLRVLFDGVPNLNTIQAPSVLEFQTFTYIGGIDSISRLPWIAYAQVGFAGCIEYLRVNDDKFIDTNKFAKQTEMQGVKTGVAQTSAAICVPGLCDPGTCQERSFNLRDANKNFYCDCSGTFKTYSSLAKDILRGETCIRDSTPFECNKKSFLLFSFDSEQITHLDDISLDFKTTSDSVTLFFATRKNVVLSTFISADLIMGQVLVVMQMQENNQKEYKKAFFPPIMNLNDGKWHTLRISRYVRDVEVYVDHPKNGIKGELYRSSVGEKFYNRIGEIYVGSRTKKAGIDKCSGSFKNFYWNENDFLNTRNYLSRYTSQLISEKPKLPTLPAFPRRPPHPCSMKPDHEKTVIPKVPVLENVILILIEVKTKYDGIVYYAEIPDKIDDWLAVLIVGNSIIVPFHLGQIKGVIEIELTRWGINIRDDTWHRIIVELNKIKSSVIIYVDDVQDLTKEITSNEQFQEIKELTFSVGGLSETVQYYKIVSKLKEYSSVALSSITDISDLKFVGCMGELLTNRDGFTENLFLKDTVRHTPLNSVFCRACQEVTKCPRNYCQNGGRCFNKNSNSIACDCSATNFYGPSCDIKNPTCSTTDCSNGGVCKIIGSVKTCNCTGTGFTGSTCELSRCNNYNCQNNGVCKLVNGQPTCDCSGTIFMGMYCDQSQCPAGFCKNKGNCLIDKTAGLPFCDCKGTLNTGIRCDKPICPPNHCKNGNCVVREEKAICYCFDDFTGEKCDIPLCSNNHCLNGGKCYPVSKKPLCSCTVDYEGDRCENPKACPQGSCLYGGLCTMIKGRPTCNCSQTDYVGSRCQVPKNCPENYCKNKGKCSVVNKNFICNCSDTGYSGSQCTNKLGCPDGFCSNGGICSNKYGQFVCDCSQTGYGGNKCDEQSKGLTCPYHKTGYPVKMFKPPKVTNGMTTSMGFQTWVGSGTIFCYQTLDDKYWSVKLIDGRPVIDINGMLFNMKTQVNDGKYHLIKVKRDNNIILVSIDFPEVETLNIPVQITNILTLKNNDIAYTKLIICNSCPDTESENSFQGSIGGAKSGNDLIADQLDSDSVAFIGPVKIEMVPMKPLPKPNNSIPCYDGYCKNGGKCSVRKYKPVCDCGAIGYEGEQCDKKIFVIKSLAPSPGYIVQNIIPPRFKQFGLWKFLAQFSNSSSPIATLVLSDGNSLEFKYINGRIEVIGSGRSFGYLNKVPLSQNVSHFFKLQTMLGRLTLYVNKTKTGAINLPDHLLMSNGSLKVIRIFVGANKNLDETIKGFIGGYSFDSKTLIFDNGTILPTLVRMNTIVVRPWIVLPHRILKPPSINIGSHGGMVYKKGFAAYENGYGSGAIVVAGTGADLFGPSVSMAGGILPVGTGFLLCIVALILLISAIIWACCTLGLIGCAGKGANFRYNVIGGGGKSVALLEGTNGPSQVMMDIENTSATQYRMELNKTYNETYLNGANFLGTGYSSTWHGNAAESTSAVYQPQNYQTINNQMSGQTASSRNIQMDVSNERSQTMRSMNLIPQAHYAAETTTMNAFSEEGLKVDSCILSYDSRFAATGSVCGPPQIWDMSNGKVIRIMEGEDSNYTSLQFALNNKLLVGLCGEGLHQTSVKKFTLWNFQTGEEIDTKEPYMATVFCMSSDNVNCVIADETKDSAIQILNLNNRQSRKIFYNQPATISNEGVQLLKITKNSQYVVAGCRTWQTQNTYIIFDLTNNGRNEPKAIEIGCLLHSCELINDNELVIGTERGELVVWNLDSALATRQILISITLDNQKKGFLKPHENKVTCIESSKDGTIMVSGGCDTLVRVFDMKDESLIQSITKHEDEVQSIALTLDNEILVTGSWDGSIRMWNLKTSQEMCCFVSSIEISKVLISNDKTVVVALGEKAGVNKLVMLKIERNIKKIVTSSQGVESIENDNMTMVSPLL